MSQPKSPRYHHDSAIGTPLDQYGISSSGPEMPSQKELRATSPRREDRKRRHRRRRRQYEEGANASANPLHDDSIQTHHAALSREKISKQRRDASQFTSVTGMSSGRDTLASPDSSTRRQSRRSRSKSVYARSVQNTATSTMKSPESDNPSLSMRFSSKSKSLPSLKNQLTNSKSWKNSKTAADLMQKIQDALSIPSHAGNLNTKNPEYYKKNPLTLTFKNWDLEERFLRHSLYGKKLLRFKLFLIGAIIFNSLFIFVDIFQVSQDVIGVWPYYVNMGLRIAAILFGVSHYIFIWRKNPGILWIEYFTAMPIFVILATTMIQSVLTTNFENNRFPVGAILVIIAAYILPRLRSIVFYPISLGVALFFVAPMIIVHAIGLVDNPLPVSRIIVFCIIIILALVISFVLNFMNEFYLRYVFILSEDLRQETLSLKGEKERSQALLENILPAHLTQKVKTDNKRFIHMYSDISVLFSDLVEFTKFSCTVSAEELIGILNKQFSCFDKLCNQYHLEKVKSVGDAFFALGGSAGTGMDHSADCIGLGLAMIEALRDMNHKYGWNFEVRVGVACGNGLLSVLGRGKLTFDVFGEAVEQGEHMEQTSIPGRVHVTDQVYHRTKNYFLFENRYKDQPDYDQSYLVSRKKMAFNNRIFRPVEVEEITYQTTNTLFSGASQIGDNTLPDFLNVNTENFLETFSYGNANTLDDFTETDPSGALSPTPVSVKDLIMTQYSQSKGTKRKQKKNPNTQKILAVELQRFFLTEEDILSERATREALRNQDGSQSTSSASHNMKLNRLTLTFDWKTSLVFYKEAYTLRSTNLKIIFSLILLFNLALCACMLATFPEEFLSPTFISWYSLLGLTLCATALYLIPFISQYALSGAIVCAWFLLSNSLYVYFSYILPQMIWDQLIGIVSCWAILSLNIFPTIPFMVKVWLNVPLVAIVILVDIIFSLVEHTSSNPFLYISLVVQSVIQLFGSYVSDLTQANVFILRHKQRQEKKNIEHEQQQNNMVIESVLPASIAERLRTVPGIDRPFVSDYIKSGSVLFAEFSGFEKGTVIDPVVAVGILNDLFSLFDMVTVKNQSFKIKSIGSTYLAVSGLQNESFHALHMANTAIEIRKQARKVLSYYKRRVLFRDVDVGIKMGCHSGPFSCGIVGESKYLYDAYGLSLNVASRLMSTGQLDKIQCSQEFYESTKNSFVLYPRGEVFLKGKGMTQTYWLVRSNEQQQDQVVQTDISFDIMDNMIVHSGGRSFDKHQEMDNYIAANEQLQHELAELRLLHAERIEDYKQEIQSLRRKASKNRSSSTRRQSDHDVGMVPDYYDSQALENTQRSPPPVPSLQFPSDFAIPSPNTPRGKPRVSQSARLPPSQSFEDIYTPMSPRSRKRKSSRTAATPRSKKKSKDKSVKKKKSKNLQPNSARPSSRR